MTEAYILLLSAASIACLHTLMGPDHYLVFAAMGKSNDWSLAKTLRVTFYCGLGHVLSSVLLGAVGILLGAQLSRLIAIESTRGNYANWALIAFGLVYLVWGLRHSLRAKKHTHKHSHDGVEHEHEHDHLHDHAHGHVAFSHASSKNSASGQMTPWVLFIVFVLGPCEALIPLFMYPAAQQSGGLVLSVALVFGVVTLATMMIMVATVMMGLKRVGGAGFNAGLRRYSHAMAGGSVLGCGLAMNLLGV